MAYDENPFAEDDTDRWQIWDMLVRRDIDAYLGQDWSMVANDFIEEGFFGFAGGAEDLSPDNWTPKYASLLEYKTDWLEQAATTQKTANMSRARESIFNVTNLTSIDIRNNLALVRKKFDGYLPLANGEKDRMNWQTVYVCRKVNEVWKIASFIGYLKYRDA